MMFMFQRRPPRKSILSCDGKEEDKLGGLSKLSTFEGLSIQGHQQLSGKSDENKSFNQTN